MPTLTYVFFETFVSETRDSAVTDVVALTGVFLLEDEGRVFLRTTLLLLTPLDRTPGMRRRTRGFRVTRVFSVVVTSSGVDVAMKTADSVDSVASGVSVVISSFSVVVRNRFLVTLRLVVKGARVVTTVSSSFSCLTLSTSLILLRETP